MTKGIRRPYALCQSRPECPSARTCGAREEGAVCVVGPEERTLWLFKALPREWLNDGEEVAIAGAPTRFG
eukprot:COSAG06_NODE_2640_length_6527_cov_67.332141_4_plen_69_part_01